MSIESIFKSLVGINPEVEYNHIVKTKELINSIKEIAVSDGVIRDKLAKVSLKKSLEQGNTLTAMTAIQVLEIRLNELFKEGEFMQRKNISSKASEMKLIVEEIKANVVKSMRPESSKKELKACFVLIGDLIPYLSGKKLINTAPDMIVMIGTPGSGKSFINDQGFENLGIKHICSDKFFERNMNKAQLSLDLDSLTPEQFKLAMSIRDNAGKSNDKLLEVCLMQGRNVVVESSGSPSSIKWLDGEAKKFGYDIHLVFVVTSLNIAKYRNSQRERQLPESALEERFKLVYSNLDEIKKVIPEDRIHVILNNEKVAGQDLLRLQKEIMIVAANMLGKNVR